MSYTDDLLLSWIAAVKDTTVLTSVHVVTVDAVTGARTAPVSTTCGHLPATETPVLGDKVTATTALCKHQRPLIPAALAP